MMLGDDEHIQRVKAQLKDKFLISECGNLNDNEASLQFLGRHLQREENSIHMYEDDQCYKNILSEMHLLQCRPAKEPAPTSQPQKVEDENFLNETDHSLYRRVVGKLQWVVVLRPDLAFTVKELARALTQPTYGDLIKLQHCVSYISDTLHFCTTLHPQLRLEPSGQQSYDVDTITDANWAGCALTRKSTSGVCVRLLGTCVHFSSRNQSGACFVFSR